MNAFTQIPSPGGNAQRQPLRLPGMIPVVLEARAGATEAPAVRIFLATEPEHYRAERIFFYSLERVRNPDRRYEIYRMTDLPGFDRRSGFAHYRFAVPELAGRQGRAIYNEVGQLYDADPAELFDLPMGDHGYLSLSVKENGLMLIDCERMASCWNLLTAGCAPRENLLELGTRRWGALDPRWHARDQEYRHGHSRLLHYTALHLQPWRPQPERYSYHIHPHAEHFYSLERTADAQGYEVHSAGQPSPAFAYACRQLEQLPAAPSPELYRYTLESVCGPMALVGPWSEADIGPNPIVRWSMEQLQRDDLPEQEAIVANGLERLPQEDIPWVVDRLFRLGRQWILMKVALGPAGSPIGTPEGWRALLRRVARRYPERGWQLDCTDRQGRPRRYRADFARRSPGGAQAPRVWILQGKHAGDNAQLVNLAQSLGWPYELKRYRSGIKDLSAPWPDLVISAGCRTAPLAREIRRRSGERTRLVVLGRPRSRLSGFDLVVTTPQYGLPLRGNVMDLPGPFISTPSLTAEELETWKQRFAHLPRPWIALLVGGKSTPYQFDTRTARILGLEASAAARARGGSLLISTSPRTGRRQADALIAALDAPSLSFRFGSGEDNPHQALLALADAFIVTGESVSMLTEACMTGKPAAMFPLPKHRSLLPAARHAFERWMGVVERDAGPNGVERPQRPRERWYDGRVEAGWFSRELSIEEVHKSLDMRPLPEGLEQPPGLSPDMLAAARGRVLQAIRELFLGDSPVPL
ncbi:ELM1/GtrOC1 family putative glycosyltransferase [Azotobacter bryophylli]|uniref:ELM1/GtrOC1 family putative glycosyltransferase n=1 Tax=Azotobacter bryophylli TaxID=1986537 RepID=A0ABV7AVN7_9GAMM